MNSARTLDVWIQSQGDCVLSGCSLVVIEVLPLVNAEKFEEVPLLFDGQRIAPFYLVPVVESVSRDLFPRYR